MSHCPASCYDYSMDLVGLILDGKSFGIDGSKGLFNAVTRSLKGYVCVQRCQWHKRREVTSYLAKGQQARIKRKMQKAYEKPTYNEAKADLLSLKPELTLMNQSAVKTSSGGVTRNNGIDGLPQR